MVDCYGGGNAIDADLRPAESFNVQVSSESEAISEARKLAPTLKPKPAYFIVRRVTGKGDQIIFDSRKPQNA
jgi:hypothetical protein